MISVASSALERAHDSELAVRASEDIEAFGELYQRYLCPIYRWVRAQVPSDAVAEDLTAQVFFRALSSAATFKGDSPYQTWIYTIARNVVSTYRTRGPRTAGEVTIPETEDPAPGPAARLVIEEEREAVRSMVTKLPPAQQEVVTLRYLRELSIGEVADATGKTAGAVRILLHRGRMSLLRALEERGLR